MNLRLTKAYLQISQTVPWRDDVFMHSQVAFLFPIKVDEGSPPANQLLAAISNVCYWYLGGNIYKGLISMLPFRAFPTSLLHWVKKYTGYFWSFTNKTARGHHN